MNEFRICDKCKVTNEKLLIKRLKEIDQDAKILVGCQNLCGIGRTKPFVVVNHIPIIGETIDDLIEKVKQKLKED